MLLQCSLTQLPDEQTRTATSLFMCVMGYMGDRQYSYPPMLAQEILRAGVDIPELRDEVYVHVHVQVLIQLIQNQLNSNPLKPVAAQRTGLAEHHVAILRSIGWPAHIF